MSRRIDLNEKRENSSLHIPRPHSFLNTSEDLENNDEISEEEVNENDENNVNNPYGGYYSGEEETEEYTDEDPYAPAKPSLRQNIANAIGGIRDKATNGAISSAKNVATTEAKAEVTKIALKNPVVRKYLIIVAAIGILFFLIILLIASVDDSNSRRGYYGLNGYPYYAGACSQVVLPDGTLLQIDDYVAGVLSREVTGSTEEVLKMMAVAARTYVIKDENKVGDDQSTCYYQVPSTTDTFQVYSPTDDDRYYKASNETRGLIITIDGVKAGAHYDASCVYTAQQARSVLPNENFSDSNYYIKYGAWDVGGDNFQPIPIEDAGKFHGTFNYYVERALAGSPCSGNHGGGISANGAEYLHTIQGYTWKDIIDYYYNGKAEIMSIYRGLSYSGNYPLDPDDPLYKNVEYFKYNISFEEFLQERGTSIEEFNNNLKAEIEAAGVGTREATVTAAMTLIGSTAEMGIKIPYDWGGKAEILGASRHWGLVYNNASICSTYHYMTGPDYCIANYHWRGFDCSGFADWAVKNGMQDVSVTYRHKSTTPLDSNTAVCKPGGVLETDGHVVLVIYPDDESKRYIIAEATGSAGLRLTYKSYGEPGYWCSNLSELYGD